MNRVRFGNVVKEIKDNVDRSNNPYAFFVAGDHMDTEELYIKRKGCFKGTDVGPAFTRIFKPGQVLYGSRRTYLKKVAMANFEGITANTTFVLESKDETKLLTKLLPFIMYSNEFTQYSISHSKGSTNPYILFKDLENYEFNLPELEEQKKLAEVLWQIVDTMESYKKLLAKTDEMVKAKFVEMFGTPITNPKKIKTDTLNNLAINLDSKRIPITSGSRKKGQYPYYGASGIVDYVDDYIFDGNYLLISEDGANLKDRVTPIAFSMSGKNWVNNHAHILKFDNMDMQQFVEFLINFIDVKPYLTGTAQPKLNQDKLNSIPILVPEMNEVSFFSNFLKKSEESKVAIQSSLNSLSAVYKKIIAENLGGK